MISATRRWLRRNRTGIAIAAGVIGATYIAGQYIVGKISEARERMQLDRIAKENLKRRFQQNQIDCTETVLLLLPTVTENVLEALPVEQLTNELQQKRAERLARAAGEGTQSEVSSAPSSLRDGDGASLSSFQASGFIHASQISLEGDQSRSHRTKAQLWNEIKISSITRALTLIYTLSLLTLLTRIQLNLLGRLNYLTSVITLAQPPPPGRANSISLEDHDDNDPTSSANFGNDFETNRRFLTFSWFLLHRGCAVLQAKVQTAVTEVFGGISPTEALTAARLSDLMLEIRKKVEGSTEQERYTTRWLPYLLPPREQEESVLIESGVITPPSSRSNESPEPLSNSEPNRTAPSVAQTSVGPLRQLLDETADLIDSPAFTRVHTLLLNALFSHLIDKRVAEQAYPAPPPSKVFSPPSSTSGGSLHPRIQELDSAVTVVPATPAEPRVKLATVLAIVTRQAHVIGSGSGNQSSSSSPPNEYVAAMASEVPELEAFAAVIYANNLDQDAIEESRPRTADYGNEGNEENNSVRSAGGTGVSNVGVEHADEMIESRLEGAWAKVLGSTFSSR